MQRLSVAILAMAIFRVMSAQASSDPDHSEEAWIAQVERDGVNAPTLSEWEQVDMGGRFMFMLHVGVGNNAGVCRLAKRDGVPPEFTRPS